MNRTPRRMLQAMDRALALWHLPAIGRAKGGVIRRLIDRHRPTNALEIGSLFGYSAILIAASLRAGGRLTCIESNDYLAKFVTLNVEAAGLGKRVTVLAADALRAIPMLRGRYDFVLLDAAKEEYLEYLRAIEPKLRPGAVVVADNTGIFRRDVKPYLDHVRQSGHYQSREHDFGTDCMEVSLFRRQAGLAWR
jgi:predicted O-methyltransferase YrrM